KDSLLAHIIKSGYRRVLSHHRGMMTYKNPKEMLKNMIFLPNKLVADEPRIWRLQERLSRNRFPKQQHEQYMKPVQHVLVKAFSELGYENPELETQCLLLIIDMLWKKEANGDVDNGEELALLLEKKYHLL